MRYFVSLAVFYASLITSTAEAAINYRATTEITGTVWNNAADLSGGGKVVSAWQDASSLGLPTVTEWVPGTFIAAGPSTIKLSGTASGALWESADIPFSVVGMQYNTTGIPNSVHSSGLGSGCSLDSVNPPLVEMRGSTCTSSQKITNNISTVPFILYRPIISINDADIETALQGQRKGIYTAMVPITIKVNYYSGSILTYRQFNEVIFITIDYDPVWITSVTLSRNDLDITPDYNATSRTVDGIPEQVQVNVNGYFDSGIRLSIDNRPYTLDHTSVTGPQIPYFIECLGCGSNYASNVELVNKNGAVVNDSTVIGDSAATNNITFSLNFGYSDVDGTTLLSGVYTDLVNIVIEPVI